jgi:hypothetical protein
MITLQMNATSPHPPYPVRASAETMLVPVAVARNSSSVMAKNKEHLTEE